MVRGNLPVHVHQARGSVELRGGLSPRSVFSKQYLQFTVERGRFQRGQRLVEHIVVLLREQLPEPIRQPGSNPDIHGLPAELLDRSEAACAADEKPVWAHGDRLQQSITLDRGSEGVDVTDVGAVPVSDSDRCDGPFQLDRPVLLAHGRSPPDSVSRKGDG